MLGFGCYGGDFSGCSSGISIRDLVAFRGTPDTAS